MKEEDETETTTALKQIDGYLLHLSNTINDFRNFFKPNEKADTVMMSEVIESLLRIIKKPLESTNIEILIENQSKKKATLFKNELIHVLLNLVNNAKEALLENGTQEAKIYIDIYDTDEKICLVIEDSNGGIPIEYQDKLFEPYFSTKGASGTGLGLYMSKSIVEQHFNGTISYTQGDKGAKFIIEIPVK